MNPQEPHSAWLPPGTTVGGYRIARPVARGGTAMVYLAQDPATRAWAALKLQRQADACDDSGRREIEAAARLSHPHIARVLGHGTHEGRAWLASEWVPGRDLTHYTQPRWLLPETRALHSAWQIAQALAHAHRQGVVHRDLKPANIRLHLPRDALKLTDFGAARIDQGGQTRSGVFVGTPAYMAPEQLRGEPPDARSDLYALGVVLYELLVGERPHGEESLGTLLRRIASGERPALADKRPDLPSSLHALSDRLLHTDPSARPADAQDVARELRGLLGAWPGLRHPSQDTRQGEATRG